MLIDLVFLGIFVWVTIRVAEEEAWGAAGACLSVLFAGLFAMNTFEPLAEYLEQKISSAEAWRFRWDVISLLGLFAGGVSLLRIVTERLAPASIPIPRPAEMVLRWLAGALAGYLTVAILLTAVHVAPLPRLVTGQEVIEIGGFEAERPQFFGLGPARQWLSFNQWISQHALNRGNSRRLFDGPIYSSGGDTGIWPSFPIRYAARREAVTRARLGLPDGNE